jgi:hypothetical protein
MRRKWMKILLVWCLLGMLSACSTGKKEGQDDVQRAGGWKVTFKVPDKVEAGKRLEYIVQVTKGTQPVTDAEVVVHLEMVNMDHGKNGFRGKMVEPGVYKGRAVLPMGGDWIAYVKVKKGEDALTQPFDFKAEGNMMLPEDMEKAGLSPDGSLKNPDF